MKKAKRLVTLATIAALTLGSAYAVTAADATTTDVAASAVATAASAAPAVVTAIATDAVATDAPVVTPEPTTAPKTYDNLSVSDVRFVGENMTDLGVYPKVKGMDDLNKKIKAEADKAYNIVGSDKVAQNGSQAIKFSYTVTDNGQYAQVTLKITYDESNAAQKASAKEINYYVDKETNTVMTKEDYTAATTAKPTEAAGVEATDAPAVETEAMVPLAVNARTLGYTVTWDDATKTVTLEKDGVVRTVTINKNAYVVNGEIIELSSAPIIQDSITYVPVSYFNTVLSVTVSYDKDGNLVLTDAATK